MDFAEYLADQQSRLASNNYMKMLWCAVTGAPASAATVDDEETYKNHLPLEFTRFLKTCVQKLRDLKAESAEVGWDTVDEQYLSTLVYFALQHEDLAMDNALYASNIFFLYNVVCPPEKQFFHKVLYVKILEALKEFYRSQDMTSNILMYVMDDFKAYLWKLSMVEEVAVPTVSVLHDYTYCCNDVFENLSYDVSFENLGYIAFVSLKILTERLSKQKHSEKKLFSVLLSLTSSLKSSNTLSRSVQVAHQKNVRLFIKDNFDKFNLKSCLVVDMLKFVYLNSEYVEYEAIANLIQLLPSDIHKNFMNLFQNSLKCDDADFRKNALKMVLPILQHPAGHETSHKRLVRSEIFMSSVVKLCADRDHDVRERALRILAEYCESSAGKQILQKIMSEGYCEINKDAVMVTLHKIADKGWRRKGVNVSYVNLICQLLIVDENLITVRTLNELREISCSALPNDLKPCIPHLKRLLKVHGSKHQIVLYVLSIFVKQMFKTVQQTSMLYAKELCEMISSNITVNEVGHDFIWHVINYLISNNFNVLAIFEKFNELNLLRSNTVRILIEHKIQNPQTRTSALKLLCVMLYFVRYTESHALEGNLEQILVGALSMSDTDILLIMHALTKMLDKKKPDSEMDNHRRIQHMLSQAFFEQNIPVVCVKYAISLLSAYAKLTQEDLQWNVEEIEEMLREKLRSVQETKLEHAAYLSRDVVHLAELVTVGKANLNPDTFAMLQELVKNAHLKQDLHDYLKKNLDIWWLCVLLHVKVCFVDPDLIPECVGNLEKTMCWADDFLQLQIMYALLDVCNMHLQYYDPLVPHLFMSLYSKNAYLRYVASKILMQLVGDEHLRLMEGQYFLFMGLLADEKDIIARNVEVFVKEKYVKKFHQTIARYFVPSIIHYNLYYEHPTIALSEADQDLLKKRIYSWNDRAFIYRCLYEFLPETLKFNILNQIALEIIVRILKKTVRHCPEVFRILEDALAVILFMLPKNKIGKIEDDRKFYEAEMRKIENELLVSDYKHSEVHLQPEHCTVLKNLLISLLQLLYSEINQNPNICQNLLFTVIAVTKNFFAAVKHVINEDSEKLKNLYKRLRPFYVKMKHQFEYCLLTINPSNLAPSSEKDTEFYLHEFPQFSLVPPSLILGMEE